VKNVRCRPGCGVTCAVPCARHGSGLTLPEVLVVLLLMGILAVMAIPDLSGFLARSRLFQQADQLTLTLRRARDLAIEDACAWRVVFLPGHGSWWCYGDADGNGRLDPGERTLGPFTLGREIFFGCLEKSGPNGTALPADGVSFTDNQVCFSPTGCCNAGSMYLTDRRGSVAIRIMPASGGVSVWHFRNGWRDVS
jgi:prepilin-type N-terminal cleavage/methylation domain-containing protein